MKKIIIPLIQLTISILAIIFYIIISSTGENMDKWKPALTMAIIFATTAILGIINLKKEEKDNDSNPKLSKRNSKSKNK